MKRSWVQALHKRFSLIYLTKFTASFPDQETVADWCEVWAEHMGGLTAAQLSHGLKRTADQCQWPPTLKEFRDWCETAPKPNLPRIAPPKFVRTDYGSRAMGLIRGMLANPKPPGNWWAHEIMAKVERNEPVTATAYNIAKEAIERGRKRGAA